MRTSVPPQAALVRTDAYLVDLDYIGEPLAYFTRLVSLSLYLPVNAPAQCVSKGLGCTVEQ